MIRYKFVYNSKIDDYERVHYEITEPVDPNSFVLNESAKGKSKGKSKKDEVEPVDLDLDAILDGKAGI